MTKVIFIIESFLKHVFSPPTEQQHLTLLHSPVSLIHKYIFQLTPLNLVIVDAMNTFLDQALF